MGAAPWTTAPTRVRWRPSVLLVALVVAACGSDTGGTGAGSGRAVALPFTFDRPRIPDGYQLAVAGRGNQPQAWGDDSVGTEEPFTVLAPPGEDATSDRVVVSVTGFEGYEGGFSQAIRGDRHGYTEVLERRGDDLAVRVTARDASRDELRAIARRVEPSSDHRTAPEVEAGDGLEVVGSVDADAVVALRGGFAPYSDEVPGPEGSYSAGWVTQPRGSLVVQTLPGDAADLAALGGFEVFGADDRAFDLRTAEVDGRSAVVLDRPHPGSASTAVVLDAPDLGLVVVVANGLTVPSDDELLALAGSVRPADRRTWEDFVVEARGGPGLHPDAGATEVTRGSAGGVDWLLQAWPDTESAPRRTGEPLQVRDDSPGAVVDTCLKLSTGRRACTAGGGDEPGFAYGYARAQRDPSVDFPPFAILQTDDPASGVRITTTSGPVTAELHEIPGGRRVALAFTDLSSYSGCERLPRIEVLGAGGRVLSCPGG